VRRDQVLQLPSIPAGGPGYPAGPYRFVDCAYVVITYEIDAEVVREQLPEPLEPLDRPLAHYE
jgi:acetoacetate decarboxylase